MVSKRDPGTRVSAKRKPNSRLGPALPKGLPFEPILRTLARIQSCQSQEKEEVGVQGRGVGTEIMASCVGPVSK